jgi:hypothetical protein
MFWLAISLWGGLGSYLIFAGYKTATVFRDAPKA